MNYLQLTATTVQKGIVGPISHLGFCVEVEQAKISEAVTEQGFWYVDVPRTSSSSIQFMLGQRFGFPFGKSRIAGKENNEGLSSALLPPHTPAYLAREIMRPQVWDEANTFSVVRDPYTWSVSLWGYTKKYGDLGLKNDTFETFLQSMKANLVGPKEGRPFFPSHFQQSDYLTDQLDKVIVKNVFKFENRDKINSFLEELGVDLVDERMMSSNTASYDLSQEEKKLVRSVFEKDFDLLGY
jgi:hypothetical protein